MSSLLIGANKAQRLYLIASVLQALPKGNAIVDVKHNLNKEQVKAYDYFEFVLTCRNRRICVFQAKKQDFNKAFGQNFLGCKVAADLDNAREVLRVVTYFVWWMFIKSQNNKTKYNKLNTLAFNANCIINHNQLRTIIEKLHSLLYKDETSVYFCFLSILTYVMLESLFFFPI